jgi:hypothetical protein
MIFAQKAALACMLPLCLAACSTADKPETKSASKAAVKVPAPFPSTYKAYPNVATAIRNVTIFDGEGNRIDNGVVLMSDGKISSVGGADTAIPSDITVFDGAGKYITPGIIIATVMRRRLRPRPKYGPSIASGRKIRGSAVRWPMAGLLHFKFCRVRRT